MQLHVGNHGPLWGVGQRVEGRGIEPFGDGAVRHTRAVIRWHLRAGVRNSEAGHVKSGAGSIEVGERNDSMSTSSIRSAGMNRKA